ncbi:FtsX-like permease family protein [Microbulbifer harenosus]|uniref:ABC transporter permease n=1 Tax=Microbulbifer harenosus TaxID=2576840 RepID=A0ABY2ULV5_9GAMM|nr:ABC transporter permease [Microbulbifer harenosus]TLM78574.1 ABC transporter permease [Microbulbifer harenosus]
MGLGTVFLSHYRRHPGQLAGLLLILVCAAMLWSGVRSLTAAAGNAVADSTAVLEPLLSVVRVDGEPLSVEDFARLRRAGLCASPRLEVRFTTGESEAPVVIGIDPLSAACLRKYRQRRGERALAEGAASVASTLMAGLAGSDHPLLLGSASDLARWRQLSLPGVEDIETDVIDGVPRGQLFADISVAADLAGAGHGRLQILLPAAEVERVPLPAAYRAEVEDYGVEPDPLVESFLLSLDALGALMLLVAALLVRSVYRFALEQRRRSLEILIRLGVTVGRLRMALIAEVLLIALAGGTVGMWLGEWLASAMATGFESTLSGLFSVDTLVMRAPTPETWLGMVLILAVVVGWACVDLLLLGRRDRHGGLHGSGIQAGGPQTDTGATSRWRGLLALVLLVLSLIGLREAGHLWLIFLAALGCLMGAGLLLPDLLNKLLACAERRCRRPLLEWSCSEMRALCRLLSLPLTALAFAIATAIGVHAMVTGFESTFARWLDQRLQGDLYLDPGVPVATEEWRARLRQIPGVTSVLPMVRTRALLYSARAGQISTEQSTTDLLPVDVLGVDPASPLLQAWPFLFEIPDLWAELARRGVLINEQLARRQSIAVGDRIRFRLGARSHTRDVIGIYADYGRPEGELMLPLAMVSDALPDRYSTFVLGAADIHSVPWQDWPQQHPWLGRSRLRDQAGLKQSANAAFARTFQMTRMLNALTLALAGTALALMGLVIFRLRQGSYTMLYVFGERCKPLRLRLIGHSVLVTGLLALLAIPLGVFLSWVLVARVNPAAFGWALPLHFYPGFWLQVWLVCLLIGAVVGVLVGNPVRLETLKNE